ncbi:hypothetical protein JW710_04855 [Candidatus Dojkabacteria bacterium]|nr:hypothetical protein [Candidatus Dojkabacteria bacterium]
MDVEKMEKQEKRLKKVLPPFLWVADLLGVIPVIYFQSITGTLRYSLIHTAIVCSVILTVILILIVPFRRTEGASVFAQNARFLVPIIILVLEALLTFSVIPGG